MNTMGSQFEIPLRGRIAIVGNGDINPSLYEQINNSNHIIRFNNPAIQALGESAKTDTLVISNSSKQTRKLLSSRSYINGPTFSKAESVIFPYHPSIIAKYMPKPNLISYLCGARADQTKLGAKVCQNTGKNYHIFMSETYLEVCHALGISKKKMHICFPSSGIMIIHALASQLDRSTFIDIYGFSFAGWKRHDWESERAYVSKLSANEHINAWI